jgi:hypothetical protein
MVALPVTTWLMIGGGVFLAGMIAALVLIVGLTRR